MASNERVKLQTTDGIFSVVPNGGRRIRNEGVRATLENTVRGQLSYFDPDPAREALAETPRRVIDAMLELTEGYHLDPAAVLKQFDGEGYDEMVLQRDIPFYSLCEHHLLPFSGVAHVGYIANGPIVGLSKLARLLDIFARRLQVQERLTAQVADALMDNLSPHGSICVVEAEHFCMTMRGVKKAGSRTITSAVRGVFRDEPTAKSEAMSLILGKRGW